jgi:CRISP-associated protein Cas1
MTMKHPVCRRTAARYSTTIWADLVLEAKAAQGYFGGWVGLPLRVDASARTRWPTPWLTVAERNSPLTRWHGPRNAVNPGQAMLNFAYTLLESQMRQALNVIGADIACGILHADQPTRDSLVYDALEGLRGLVDDLMLTFWQQHVFSAGDCQANTAGVVQLHPTLRRVLVETVRLPQRRVDDEARWLRSLLLGRTIAAAATTEDEDVEDVE